MSLSLRSKEPQLVSMGTSFPRHLFHQHSNCRRISVRETEYVPPVNCFISTKKKKEDMIYHNMHHFRILTLVEGIFIVVVSRGALHTTYPSNLLLLLFIVIIITFLPPVSKSRLSSCRFHKWLECKISKSVHDELKFAFSCLPLN